MESVAENDHGKMAQALEEGGTFLHLEAKNLIEHHGWKPLIEFPSSGAPFVSDPMKQPGAVKDGMTDPRMFQEVVRRSQDPYRGSKREVDIFASKTEDVRFNLCVEVKKRNPEFVKFVLLERQDETSGFSVVAKSMQKGVLDLMSIPRINSEGLGLFVTIKQFNLNPSIKGIYDFGLTLTKKGGKYKFQDNHLRDAAIQVAEGTYGIILDSVTRQIVNSAKHIDEYFVPVIVTNAEIYTVTYDVEKTDSESGKVKNIKFKNEDRVVYKSPMLASTTFPNQATGIQTTEQVKQASRWPVIVTNMKGLKRLLEAIDGSRPVENGAVKPKTAHV